MANARLMQVKLNSVDVTAYVRKWRIKRDFGNSIDSMEVEFVRSVEDVVTVSENGQTLEAWFGTATATDKKYFNGYVEKFKTDTGVYECTAYSVAYATVRELIGYQRYDPTIVGNPVEPDGKYSDAFIDIVTTHAGLSADSTTVDDTGTDPAKVIKKFVCFETDPKERMDKIAEAFQKIWYYRADTDKIYLRSPNTTVNPEILEVGVNVQNVPEWEYTKDYLINDLRVRGVYQASDIEDTFNGDGSTQSFELSYSPLGSVSLYYSATKNYETTNNPLPNEQKVLGVDQTTSTSYDFTVDKVKKTISTVGGNGGGFTPASGTKNILVKYTALVEIPVHIVDDLSVLANRRYAKRWTLKDTITAQDVIARSTEIVAKFKDPFKSASLKVPWSDGVTFELGDSIRVIDAKSPKPIDEFLTIWGITYQWPDGHDIIKVGDREFQEAEYFLNMNEKLAALESEVFDENAIYTEVRSASTSAEFAVDTFDVELELKNDSFIVGMLDNGMIHSSTSYDIISDFESAADWAQGTGSETLNETNDSTAGHFWVGTQGLNYSWTAVSGFGRIENTTASKDWSGIVLPYCYNFDGTADYILAPDNAAYAFTPSTPFTINCWVNPDSPSSSNRRVWSKGGSSPLQGYQLLHNENTGSVAWQMGNGTTTNTSPTGTISGGSGWHMITCVWDTAAAKIRLYIDGAQVSTGNAITLTGTTTNAHPFGIGTLSDNPGAVANTEYDGRIANTAMWSRALGDAEIAALYTLPRVASSTNLVGWWKLNDNHASVAADSSVTANDGAITNATVSSTWFYPWRGTVGIWGYCPTPNSVSGMRYEIGSSSTDKLTMSGKQYAWVVTALESSFNFTDEAHGRNYVLFDLDAATWGTKAIDWTAVDFRAVEWDIAAAGNITFDYNTASRSDIIGLNGLGDRSTVFRTDSYSY